MTSVFLFPADSVSGNMIWCVWMAVESLSERVEGKGQRWDAAAEVRMDHERTCNGLRAQIL